MSFSKKSLAAVATFAALGLAANAHAQTVEFSGFTSGCFYLGPTACAANVTAGINTAFVGSNEDNNGLIFFDGAFDDFITGSAHIGGIGDNLGSLNDAILAKPTNYNGLGESFALYVTFVLPTEGGSDIPALYTAMITGNVTTDAHSGGPGIHFNNSTQTFAFDGPGDQAGTFTLTVDNGGISGSATENFVSADISTNVAPEPATIGLFVSGLVGLIPVARRRRNQA